MKRSGGGVGTCGGGPGGDRPGMCKSTNSHSVNNGQGGGCSRLPFQAARRPALQGPRHATAAGAAGACRGALRPWAAAPWPWAAGPWPSAAPAAPASPAPGQCPGPAARLWEGAGRVGGRWAGAESGRERAAAPMAAAAMLLPNIVPCSPTPPHQQRSRASLTLAHKGHLPEVLGKVHLGPGVVPAAHGGGAEDLSLKCAGLGGAGEGAGGGARGIGQAATANLRM